MFGQKGQNAQSVGDLDGDGDVDEDDVKIQYQRVRLFLSLDSSWDEYLW
jgi:hypothetical protein